MADGGGGGGKKETDRGGQAKGEVGRSSIFTAVQV